MSGVGSARVILSVCLSLLHPVSYCRTDLRQLSFLKMFLVIHNSVLLLDLSDIQAAAYVFKDTFGMDVNFIFKPTDVKALPRRIL